VFEVDLQAACRSGVSVVGRSSPTGARTIEQLTSATVRPEVGVRLPGHLEHVLAAAQPEQAGTPPLTTTAARPRSSSVPGGPQGYNVLTSEDVEDDLKVFTSEPAATLMLNNRPDKPDRNAIGKRIDAVPTAAMAVTRWRELAAKHARSGRLVVPLEMPGAPASSGGSASSRPVGRTLCG
jgi:hypothetical protein